MAAASRALAGVTWAVMAVGTWGQQPIPTDACGCFQGPSQDYTGTIPTELGLCQLTESFCLYDIGTLNADGNSTYTELGQLSLTKSIAIYAYNITGPIPTQLG